MDDCCVLEERRGLFVCLIDCVFRFGLGSLWRMECDKKERW